eukprot:TRINITY_DN703_c1_g1_i11.p1 TRINITY_DN703_c1_g1~~TRINITY_DN703_c1_g1_i11.p1  ORF type:complete len:1636 (+),score=709.57 TRINITY_DN703_c1_g1_i11:36-4910(+)
MSTRGRKGRKGKEKQSELLLTTSSTSSTDSLLKPTLSGSLKSTRSGSSSSRRGSTLQKYYDEIKVHKAGESVNPPKHDEENLYRIASHNDFKMCEKLIKKKNPNLDWANDEERGFTALHCCSYFNYLESTELLLDYGADANANADKGRTPLHMAVLHGSDKARDVLLKRTKAGSSKIGAKLSKKNKPKKQQYLKVDAVDTTKNFTPLHYACMENDVEAIHALVKHKADIWKLDQDGNCSLHLAADKGATDVVIFLIKQYPDMVTYLNGWNEQPLLKAVHSGHEDIVELLLNTGMCDVEMENVSGVSALKDSVYNGSAGIVNMLIENGADLHRKDANGNMAIHYAAAMGHAEVSKVLVSHGAEVNKLDYTGRTAMDYAMESDAEMVRKLLQDRGADDLAIEKQNSEETIGALTRAGGMNGLMLMTDAVRKVQYKWLEVLKKRRKSVGCQMDWVDPEIARLREQLEKEKLYRKRLDERLQGMRDGMTAIINKEKKSLDSLKTVRIRPTTKDAELLQFTQDVIDACRMLDTGADEPLMALRKGLRSICNEEKEGIDTLEMFQINENTPDQELLTTDRQIIAFRKVETAQLKRELNILRTGLLNNCEVARKSISKLQDIELDENTKDSVLLDVDQQINRYFIDQMANLEDLKPLRTGLMSICRKEIKELPALESEKVDERTTNKELLDLDQQIIDAHREDGRMMREELEQLQMLRDLVVEICTEEQKDVEELSDVEIDDLNSEGLAGAVKTVITTYQGWWNGLRDDLLKSCLKERVGFADLEQVELDEGSDDDEIISMNTKIIEAAKAGAGPILERLEKLRSELIAVLDQEKQAVHELADKSFNEGSSDQELVDAERQIMAALKDHNLGEVTAALEALRKGLKDIVEREKQGVGSLEDVVVGAETKDAELLDLDSKIIEARKAEIAKVQGLLDGLRQGLVKIVTEEGSEGVSVSVEETDDKTLLSADGAIHAERREALAKMSERVSGLRSGIAGVVNKERGSDVLDVDSDADDKLIEEDAAVHQERREALEQIKQQLEGLRSGLLDVVNEEGEEDISGEVSDKEMIAADRKIHQARASLVNILTKQLDTLRSGLVDIINEERDEFDDLEEANVVMGDQKMLEADKTIIRTRREEIKKLRIELQDLRAGLLRICEHERVGFDDIEKLELNSDSDDQTLLSIDQKIIDAAKAGVQPVIDRLEALRRSLIQIIDEEKEAVHELANKEFGEGSKDEELVSAERKIIYALKDHNLEQITAELEALRRGLTEIVQREKEGIESMDGLNVDESTSDGTLLNLDAKIIDARKAESAAVRKELDELRDGLAKIVNEEGESDVTKDSGDDQLLKLDHTIHRNRAAELDQIKEDLLKLRKGLVVIVNAAGKDIENMEPVRVDSGDKAILAQDQKILDMRQSQIEELSMDLKRIRAGLLRICEHERVGFDDIEKLELNSDSDDQTLLSIDQKIIDAAKAGVQPVIDRLEALRRSLIQIIDEEKEAVHELANKEFGEGSKDEELVSAERKIIYALKDHNLEQITAELEALRRGLTEIVQREKEGIESMDGLNVDESTSDGTLLNLDAKIIDARKAESAAVRKELDELRDGLAKIVNEAKVMSPRTRVILLCWMPTEWSLIV